MVRVLVNDGEARCSKCRSVVALPADACPRCGKPLAPRAPPEPAPSAAPERAAQPSKPTRRARQPLRIGLLLAFALALLLLAALRMGALPDLVPDRVAGQVGDPDARAPTSAPPGAPATPSPAGAPGAAPPDRARLSPFPLSPGEGARVWPQNITLSWGTRGDGIPMRPLLDSATIEGCDWGPATQCVVSVAAGTSHTWAIEWRPPGQKETERTLPITFHTFPDLVVHVPPAPEFLPEGHRAAIDETVRRAVQAWDGTGGRRVHLAAAPVPGATPVVYYEASPRFGVGYHPSGEIPVILGEKGTCPHWLPYTMATVNEIAFHSVAMALGYAHDASPRLGSTMEVEYDETCSSRYETTVDVPAGQSFELAPPAAELTRMIVDAIDLRGHAFSVCSPGESGPYGCTLSDKRYNGSVYAMQGQRVVLRCDAPAGEACVFHVRSGPVFPPRRIGVV